MNFWSNLRKPQTLTILAGAISSVSSPLSNLPVRTASESKASTAAATACSRKFSGSIECVLLLSAGEIGPGPVQRALLPDVKESGEDQNDENQHFDECEHLELAVYDHPRVQEDGLDV